MLLISRMPYREREKLCFILDQKNKWQELGLNYMGFNEVVMDNVGKVVFRGDSPSDELLKIWGYTNHTITELFMLLSRMGFYQGMSILKPLVNYRLHALIKEDNINVGIKRLQVQDSKVPSNNFKKDTVKNVPKKDNFVDSNESNSCQRKTIDKPSNQAGNPSSPRGQVQKESTKVLTQYVASRAGATPQIPYQELEEATDNWSSSEILGQGGFGTVFGGWWKLTRVAVKRLESKENTRKDLTEQIRQSVTELRCLNAYRHDNVLPLYGYSIGGPHPCLVYQYMPGGSLDVRIRTKNQKKVLSWPTRLKIATGTARGLQFLHTALDGKPLIHGDIKSANILLDLMDQPRIGDFGLAREGPDGQKNHILVSRVQGTLPYLPEEFLQSGHLSTKVDTYSFGVVLFELATAYRPTSHLKHHLVNYPGEHILELKDPKAEGGDVIFRKLMQIGKVCVMEKAKDRPEMVSVLLMLEKVTK